MPIPAFDSEGVLPEGRHQCSIDEIEESLVDDPQFESSSTRRKIFSDFRAAEGLLASFDQNLIERIWIGGGFASTSQNPEDIDVTFMLNEKSYLELSNRAKERLSKLCRKGGFKATNLDVDGFFFVHELNAMPWAGAWLGDSANAT